MAVPARRLTLFAAQEFRQALYVPDETSVVLAQSWQIYLNSRNSVREVATIGERAVSGHDTHWLRVVVLVLEQLVFMLVAPLVAGWRGSQRTQNFARVLRASAAFPGASS